MRRDHFWVLYYRRELAGVGYANVCDDAGDEGNGFQAVTDGGNNQSNERYRRCIGGGGSLRTCVLRQKSSEALHINIATAIASPHFPTQVQTKHIMFKVNL